MNRLHAALALTVAVPVAAAPLPPGRVPPPAAYDVGAHELPIAPTTDVMWRAKQLDDYLFDAIAPLGDGPANAAEWWRDFSELDGKRAKELDALRLREVRREVAGSSRLYFAWDDPFVQEARATADQARLSFFPGVWPHPDFWRKSEFPGLIMITTSTSWMVHGLESPDPRVAREDFRRMIRLGRLMLQDDASVLQHGIGMRILRDGLEALYDRARRDGDRPEQMLVALAILDRVQVAEWERGRFGQIELPGHVDLSDPSARLSISEDVMDTIEAAYSHSTARRWKLDALRALQVAMARGDAASASRAATLLRSAAESGDPMVASVARRALAGEGVEQAELDELGTDRDRAAARKR